MKTLNALFSIAAITLCCSTAVLAGQNAGTPVAALDPAGREVLVITAPRVTSSQTLVLSAADRGALTTSIKMETRKEIQHSIQQLLTEKTSAGKKVVQSPKHEALQASL